MTENENDADMVVGIKMERENGIDALFSLCRPHIVLPRSKVIWCPVLRRPRDPVHVGRDTDMLLQLFHDKRPGPTHP